eukprot:g12978.t1
MVLEILPRNLQVTVPQHVTRPHYIMTPSHRPPLRPIWHGSASRSPRRRSHSRGRRDDRRSDSRGGRRRSRDRRSNDRRSRTPEKKEPLGPRGGVVIGNPEETEPPTYDVEQVGRKHNGDPTFQAILNIKGQGGRIRSLRAPPRANEDCTEQTLSEHDINMKQYRAPVQLTCEGESFLSCWTFFTEADPTHGDVQYVSEEEAKSLGLFQINDGVVHLGSLVGQNGPAKSIRLQSANRFGESHIFVIDIKHMPTGLGTWPAWWSYGPDWPNNGEIDTIETVNIEEHVQSTLHTSYGCRMPMVPGLFNPDCNSADAHDGCGLDGPSNSGGPPFNAAGGGVFATQWTSTGIKMWFWKRADIPSDITSDAPDSTSWGEPYVFFPFGENCPSSHFKDHVLTINLDFCGDWAGNVFPGGLAKCVEFIQDPANVDQLKDAYWDINYQTFRMRFYNFNMANSNTFEGLHQLQGALGRSLEDWIQEPFPDGQSCDAVFVTLTETRPLTFLILAACL